MKFKVKKTCYSVKRVYLYMHMYTYTAILEIKNLTKVDVFKKMFIEERANLRYLKITLWT